MGMSIEQRWEKNKEEILKFLNSEDKILCLTNDTERKDIIKLPYVNDYELIYMGSNYFNGKSEELKFSGIIDNRTKEIIDIQYNLEKSLHKWDELNVKYDKLEKKKQAFQQKINDTFNEKYLDNFIKEHSKINEVTKETYLEVEDVEHYNYLVENNTREYYILGKDLGFNIEKFEVLLPFTHSVIANDDRTILMSEYDNNIIDNCIKQLINDEDKSKIICQYYYRFIKTRELLKELEKEPNVEEVRLKKLHQTLKQINAKTITICYEKDNKTWQGKYEADYMVDRLLGRYKLSTWYIVNKAERSEFENTFGRIADIEFDGIQQILYKGKVIYDRKDV